MRMGKQKQKSRRAGEQEWVNKSWQTWMRVGECKQRQESNSSSGSNSGSSLLLLFYFIFSLSNYNFYSTSMHDTMGFVRHQQTQVQNVSNCNFYNFYTTGMYDTAGLWDTMQKWVQYVPVPIMGMVWKILTCSVPMMNPSHWKRNNSWWNQNNHLSASQNTDK